MVLISGGHRSMYGRQAGSMHSTGMLSYLMDVLSVFTTGPKGKKSDNIQGPRKTFIQISISPPIIWVKNTHFNCIIL